MSKNKWLPWVMLAVVVLLAAVLAFALVRINQLNDEAGVLRGRNARLSQEMADIDGGKDMIGQLKAAKTRGDELEAALTETQALLEAAQQKEQQLSADVASLQAQVEALTPDLSDPDDLETQLFKVRNELEKQRANVETLKEQLTKDQRQLQALTRENALLRIESASQVKDPDAAYQDLLKEANELFAQVDA